MNIRETIKKILGPNNVRKVRETINNQYRKKISRTKIEPFNSDLFPYGINLIGNFSQDSGLGQSCRLVAKIIEQANIPHSFINFSLSNNLNGSNKDYDDKLSSEYKYSINLFHINMHEFTQAFRMIGKRKFNHHYNIAYWLWEMQEFPEEWVSMINVLDEIWTPSEFVSEAIRKVTDKPVRTIPYILEAPYEEKYDRSYFGLPADMFLYLMLFDNNSIAERKNPYGVIEAFKKAYPNKDDDIGLVVKIGNADDKTIQNVKKALEGYNAFYINERLSKIEVNSLIRDVDVYISLHRSEGYGLVLAESMLLGTPTIATNYSANIEFQNKDNSCLVDYTLIPVGKDIYPYKKDYLWAEPDILQASEYIKLLKNDKNYYSLLADKSKLIKSSKSCDILKNILLKINEEHNDNKE